MQFSTADTATMFMAHWRSATMQSVLQRFPLSTTSDWVVDMDMMVIFNIQSSRSTTFPVHYTAPSRQQKRHGDGFVQIATRSLVCILYQQLHSHLHFRPNSYGSIRSRPVNLASCGRFGIEPSACRSLFLDGTFRRAEGGCRIV